MAELLMDTAALIAFFVGSERHHQAIKTYCEQNPSRWIILSTVFDETVTWLRSRVSIEASIQVGTVLRSEHHYIHLSEDDDRATWEAFARYRDKPWSYTDCSLLVVATRLGVANVASFDIHIRQMSGLGIVCVPTIAT